MNNLNTRCVSDLQSEFAALPQHFYQMLEQSQSSLEIIEADQALPTAQCAATYCQVDVNSIIKTLLLKSSKGEIVAVVLRGGDQLNQASVRQMAGIKKFRFLKGDEVRDITGFIPGGVPPFGFGDDVIQLIDENVLANPIVVGGGGMPHLLIKTSPQTLLSNGQFKVGQFINPSQSI